MCDICGKDIIKANQHVHQLAVALSHLANIALALSQYQCSSTFRCVGVTTCSVTGCLRVVPSCFSTLRVVWKFRLRDSVLCDGICELGLAWRRLYYIMLALRRLFKIVIAPGRVLWHHGGEGYFHNALLSFFKLFYTSIIIWY